MNHLTTWTPTSRRWFWIIAAFAAVAFFGKSAYELGEIYGAPTAPAVRSADTGWAPSCELASGTLKRELESSSRWQGMEPDTVGRMWGFRELAWEPRRGIRTCSAMAASSRHMNDGAGSGREILYQLKDTRDGGYSLAWELAP